MERRKPILVTGASGMLGSAFQGPRFTRTSSRDFDIRDPRRVCAFLGTESFSAVLHLAALTNLETCEEAPLLAFETNSLGTKHLAVACAAHQIPLIYISTSGVFGGLKQSIYHETDQPHPQTVYAESKLQGENHAKVHHPKSLILRLPWLFGGYQNDKKFVGEFLRRLDSGQNEFQIVDDTVGSLLFNQDLADEISPLWQLLRNKNYGLFHVAHDGKASRFEMAKTIVRALDLEHAIKLSPIVSDHWKPKVQVLRPQCEVLGSNHLAALRPWAAALCAYAQDWKNHVR